MIEGKPANKCKAVKAREDEQQRAEERAKQAKMQSGKKAGKQPRKATPADTRNAKRRKCEPTGARKEEHEIDPDGFIIPHGIPLSEMYLVEVEVNGLPRHVPTIAFTKEQAAKYGLEYPVRRESRKTACGPLRLVVTAYREIDVACRLHCSRIILNGFVQLGRSKRLRNKENCQRIFSTVHQNACDLRSSVPCSGRIPCSLCAARAKLMLCILRKMQEKKKLSASLWPPRHRGPSKRAVERSITPLLPFRHYLLMPSAVASWIRRRLPAQDRARLLGMGSRRSVQRPSVKRCADPARPSLPKMDCW